MIELKKKIGFGLIVIVGITLILVLVNQDAIPQDPRYHHFSDIQPLLSIPNLLNVISNLPFLFIGLLGLYKLIVKNQLCIDAQNRYAYVALFSGIALVALGSGYYHLWPDNQTLVWDRLPMTVAFMGLISIMISEFISVNAGKILLLPLLILGLSSVGYWHLTEMDGAGDLRFYVMVQFFPMLAIPIILLTFK
jgi:hypothetical protein